MKKLLSLALFCATLAACNDTSTADELQQAGEGVFYLTVSHQGSAASTRSVDDQLTSGDYAVIYSGIINFLDSGGESVFRRDLTDDEVTTLKNLTDPGDDNSAGTETSGNQITIEGVPTTAVSLQFIANVATVSHPDFPALESLDNVGEYITIDNLQEDVRTTPMSGISGAFTVQDNVTTATVTIQPLAARIEIGQITCSSTTTPITSFDIAGIYIDSIYTQLLTTGYPASTDKVSVTNQNDWDTDDWGKYFSGNTTFPYFAGDALEAPTSWFENAMSDEFALSIGGLTLYPNEANGVSDEPTSNKVWSYQVVPSAESATAESPDVPKILIKLINVEYGTPGLGESELYLTVDKYTGASGSIYSFDAGNVYSISNLTFSYSNTSDKPYEDKISVQAEVKVKPWIINEITPDWD